MAGRAGFEPARRASLNSRSAYNDPKSCALNRSANAPAVKYGNSIGPDLS